MKYSLPPGRSASGEMWWTLMGARFSVKPPSLPFCCASGVHFHQHGDPSIGSRCNPIRASGYHSFCARRRVASARLGALRLRSTWTLCQRTRPVRNADAHGTRQLGCVGDNTRLRGVMPCGQSTLDRPLARRIGVGGAPAQQGSHRTNPARRLRHSSNVNAAVESLPIFGAHLPCACELTSSNILLPPGLVRRSVPSETTLS